MKIILLILGYIVTAWAIDDGPIVAMNYGKIQGFVSKTSKDHDLYTFHNIPFAKPPIGRLRFQDPEIPQLWEGIRNGVKEHRECPQPNLFSYLANQTKEYEGQEDCLYLSVYSPKIDGDRFPVMFFIHGGAFLSGGARFYDGKYLVDENVVLVCINYRLGILGFLSTEDEVIPANIGLKDQIMALKWVQENIEHFGGDPKRVTIFGESAGGASVHFHILSPYSRGLFSKAILQSGNAICPWSHTTGHRDIALQVGATVGCFTPSTKGKQQSRQLLKCLQQIDEESLTLSLIHFMNFTMSTLNFAPYVDGEMIPDEPETLLKTGNQNQVDIMIGVTADDGSFFTLNLFSENDFLEKLRHNFEYYGPVSLGMSYDDNSEELSRKAYFHYLNKNTFDVGDVEELTKMYGDRHFGVCTDLVAQMHANTVYLYEFAYKGTPYFGSLYQRKFGSHWITHIDDLFYLFPLDKLELQNSKLNENDDKVKNIMIKLWSNFARSGNPTPDDSLNFKWTSFNKEYPKHLFINANPEMKEHLRKEVQEFWKSLPIRQNRLLFDSVTKEEKYEL